LTAKQTLEKGGILVRLPQARFFKEFALIYDISCLENQDTYLMPHSRAICFWDLKPESKIFLTFRTNCGSGDCFLHTGNDINGVIPLNIISSTVLKRARLFGLATSTSIPALVAVRFSDICNYEVVSIGFDINLNEHCKKILRLISFYGKLHITGKLDS
jgi:hypothetical protein